METTSLEFFALVAVKVLYFDAKYFYVQHCTFFFFLTTVSVFNTNKLLLLKNKRLAKKDSLFLFF